jgi:hypothetical protein
VVPWPHPNFDFSGPQSLDQDWWNQGWPVDYAGDFGIKNGTAPDNQASQKLTLNAGQNMTAGASANIGYISPENPQDKVGGFGRILIEQTRQAYNAAHPGEGLPDPAPGQPVWVAYDALRAGDGYGGSDPQNPLLAMRADLIGVNHLPVPGSLIWTAAPDAERKIPNDSTWRTYKIGNFDGFPEKVYMGIGISMDASPAGFGATTGPVTVWIDNVRVIYMAIDPDACAHDPVFDVDDDGDVDHADFGVFQACLTGANDPGGIFSTLFADCQCMDVAGVGGQPDDAIDQQDYAIFDNCATGPAPAVAVDPACDG